MSPRTLLLASCLIASAGPAAAQQVVKLPATADVWVSNHPAERDFSMGRTSRLKLKALEEMALLDFDLAPLGNRPIATAELFVRSDPNSVSAERKRLKLSGTFPLRLIGVSTVSAPWVEGGGERTGPDPSGRGATFNQSGGGKPWAWAGSRLHDVIFSNGQSAYCRGELEHVGRDGWWKVKLDPAVIERLRAGGGFGLCVTDDSTGAGWMAANNYVFSREQSGSGPYLTVTLGPARPAAAAGPLRIVCEPAPKEADLAGGAVRITLTPPAGAAAYELRLDGRALEPWQVARPGPAGRPQTFVVRDLPPDKQVTLELTARGPGLALPPARATVRTSPALPPPAELPAGPVLQGDVPRAGVFSMTAVPETVKVDPFGRSLEPAGPGPAWGDRIALSAARGQIVACQLLIAAGPPDPGPVRVSVGDFVGPGGRIASAGHVRLFREWYVKVGGDWHPELAIPLDGPVAIPDPHNQVAGQTHQLVWADLFVPPGTRPGEYAATATAAAGGQTGRVTIKLKVSAATIPSEIHFSPELNAYGPPAAPGSASYFAAHRLAHYHRAAINIVPYGQGRRGDEAYRPTLAGAGAELRAADWAAFDRNHGPLLDGSAFKDNPRGATPVAAFYLPLYEYWPVPFLENYAFKRPAERDTITLHHLTAPPLERAVSRPFQEAFAAASAEFARHAAERRWTATVFQCYLNNKFDMSHTMFWTLDEPACRQDYAALAFFGKLFGEGVKRGLGPAPAPVKLWFRGDVSRPQWQFDAFDGVMQVEYVNGDAFNMVRTVRDVTRRGGIRFHVYGSCNEVGRSNLESAAWCLKSFLAGAGGVLPWNSIDRTGNAAVRPNVNGLIVAGGRAGCDGWVASLRVFALRRGAQDAELLRLLAERKGYTLDQLAALVGRYVPLSGEFRQRFADEAAAVRFEKLSADGLAQLEAGLLAALDE